MEESESPQENIFALTVDAILLKSSHEIDGGIHLSHKDGVVTIKWLEDLRLSQPYYTENRNKLVRISENEVCLFSAEDEEGKFECRYNISNSNSFFQSNFNLEYIIIPIIKKDVIVPLMLDFRMNDPSLSTSGIPVFKDGKEDLGRVIFSLTELPIGVKFTDEGANQKQNNMKFIPGKTAIVRKNEDTFEINGKVLYSLHRKTNKTDSNIPENTNTSPTLTSNSSTVIPVVKSTSDEKRLTPSPKNSPNSERANLSKSDNFIVQEEKVDTDFLNSKMKSFDKKLEVVKLKKTKEAEKRLKSMMSNYERKYSHSFSHDENKYVKSFATDTPIAENADLMNSSFVKGLVQKVATKKDEVKSKVDTQMQKYRAKLDPNAVQPPPSPEPTRKIPEPIKPVENLRQPLTKKFSSFEVMSLNMYLMEPVRLYSEYLSLPDDHFTADS